MPAADPVISAWRLAVAKGQERRVLNCPRCSLTIKPRARWLEIEHCPRCMARSRIAIRLFSSSLSVAELHPDRAPCRARLGPTQPRLVLAADRGLIRGQADGLSGHR